MSRCEFLLVEVYESADALISITNSILWTEISLVTNTLKLMGMKVPLTKRTKVYEQAGGAGGQAIRSAELSESARIARSYRLARQAATA